MRIIVPIKQVPETTAVKMDEASGTMIREGVEAIVNPLDLYAIELAIRLREQSGGTGASPAAGAAGVSPAVNEVVAISMGPAKAADALREALAMGCDRAVLISDKAFAGSDTWATSRVLAAAIRKLIGGPAGAAGATLDTSTSKTPVPPYLVICGERATDGDTGQVGPGIAAFLDLPVLTYVGEVESLDVQLPHSIGGAAVAPAGGTIRVRRLVEAGHELLESSLPCVLTVVKEIADPRLPTLRGKQRARQTEIPVWGPAELGIAPETAGLAGSPTRVEKIFRPRVTREGIKLRAAGDAELRSAVAKLVAFLKEKQL